MDEPIGPEAAKQLIRRILQIGRFTYSRHAKEELAADGLTTVAGCRDGVEEADLSPRIRKDRSKCSDCGTPMKSRRENYRYDECGLSHVTLVAVPVARCPRCGNYQVSIPNIEGLHRLIACSLIEKKTRLRGEEVRYLRKSLGWSGGDFARHMGVAEETVSRWENDATPIGPQADRLLRLMVAHGGLRSRYPTTRLAQINTDRAYATRLELLVTGRQWGRMTA